MTSTSINWQDPMESRHDMNVARIKWIGPLFPALFIGLFEFVRHDFLNVISMNWGNLMVAGLTGVLFFFYFQGILAWLQTLNANLQKRQEEIIILKERDHIARELHDSVSQALFFMNIKVIEIEAALRQERQPFKEVKELKEAIKFTDTDIRQHIFNLQNVRQERVDLTDSVREMISSFQEQSGSKVDLVLQGDLDARLSHQEKSNLIRILQEVFFNIRKHAKADRVQVNLIASDNRLTLRIEDNGTGFHAGNPKGVGSSFGLRMIEERAQAINAKRDWLHDNQGIGS
jgi:signal transduction histidine kinase